MSARTAIKYQDVFDALVLAVGSTPALAAANATLTAKLDAVLNRAYARGYNKRLWEDAWDGATVSPSNRLIAFSAISDARRFEVWDEDPRDPDNGATELRYTTTLNGLLLMDDATSVFVLSMPKAPKFTTTAYASGTTYAVGALVLATDRNVYRCIQQGAGHEPSASSAYWTVVPFLAVLEEFCIAYAKGTYQLENGQEQTGAALRSDALAELEQLAITEYCRTANSAWRPKP